jgi:hypothetical protein
MERRRDVVFDGACWVRQHAAQVRRPAAFVQRGLQPGAKASGSACRLAAGRSSPNGEDFQIGAEYETDFGAEDPLVGFATAGFFYVTGSPYTCPYTVSR